MEQRLGFREGMEQRCDYGNVDMNPLKSRRVSASSGIHESPKESIDILGSLQRSVWPVIPAERENDPLPASFCSLAVLFDNILKRQFSDDDHFTELVYKKPDVEIGQYFDVVSLLSCNYSVNDVVLVRNNGDQVELKKDVFKDKNVIICCFNVPVFRGDHTAARVQALANICSDLYAQNPDNFEMVVVPKMHSLANHLEVYEHFMSGFPPSCLALPFSYRECRDYACNFLNLCILYSKCLIVDGGGNVLYCSTPNFAPFVGADAFPFTFQLSLDYHNKDLPLWESRATSTLEGLLQCDSSLVLDKIGSSQETMSISKLKEKVVGLYLFLRGDLLLELNAIYEQCRASHPEFEVVLVYLPFSDCLDPRAAQDKIDRLLLSHNISWWRVPYNDSVSRRLWYFSPSSPDDRLIILGPHDRYVDPCGREVMKNYGISAYPFTREVLVQRELIKLQELTLESLLVHQSRNYVFHHDDEVPVEQLKGRNILVYFGCLAGLELYHNLCAWYPKIKEKDSSYEVVFVRRAVDYISESNVAEDDAAARSIMPWLVCPFNRDHSLSVQEKLFLQTSPHDSLIQFGTDGRSRSVEADVLLETHGIDGFPFNDNLRQDIIRRFFNCGHEFMESYK